MAQKKKQKKSGRPLQRRARFCTMGKRGERMGKKAVVLGGGGSRGSYQIGVWKALRELGFRYEIVTGTSVGALNGALMVQDDYELAEAMWHKLKTTDVMAVEVTDKIEGPRDFTNKLGAFITEMVKGGGVDPRPLEQMLREYVDEDKMRHSPVDFGFITVEYPKLTSKILSKDTIPAGEMVDYLMASAACFPAMKARVIGEKTYIDGGYYDNVPVRMAVEMGADDIVAVDLEAVGVVRPMRFPNVRLRYLKCRWDLGVFLLFDTDATTRNVRLGYLDTLKAFDELEGCLYALEKGETALLYRQVKKQGEILTAQTGLYVAPGNLYPAQSRAQKKLRQLADWPSGTLSPERITLACCEAAARLLGLSPLEIYTAASLEDAMLCAYNDLHRQAQKIPEILAARSVKELTQHLRGLERPLIMLYCCRFLEERMEGKYSPTAARMLCSATTEEFLAAMYLSALKRKRKQDA